MEILFAFSVLGTPWNVPRPDPRFGIVEAFNAPQAARAASAAWQRVRFDWAALQPDGPAGAWQPGELSETQLNRELAEGREIVGLLIGVPGWARDSTGLPEGLHLPFDDPGNLWAGFVRRTVGQYRGRIRHWIVWNEPDIWQPDHPAYSWPGTVDDFVQLTKVSYLAAHNASPEAVIHLASVTHYWDANFGRELYFKRFLDAVTRPEWGGAAHGYFFDLATLHLYFNPEANFDLLIRYKDMLREYGLDKPIWLVETNAPPSDDPTWPVAEPLIHVSQEEQAAYIPQMLTLALAAGVERVGLFKMRDAPRGQTADPEPFGLVRLDGSPRPGYFTFRVATQMLAGMSGARVMERGIWLRVRLEGRAGCCTCSGRASRADRWPHSRPRPSRSKSSINGAAKSPC